MMRNDLLMTNSQVTKLLNVSPRTLRRWQKSHNLPAYKVGRGTFYFESEIVEFIKSMKRVDGLSIK